MQGAIVTMIAHGFSTAALFMMAGAIQQRLHTREMSNMGGLWIHAPRMGVMTLFFVVASVGMPGPGTMLFGMALIYLTTGTLGFAFDGGEIARGDKTILALGQAMLLAGLFFKQTSMKRLLAYSSIAHLGYLLIALLVAGAPAAAAPWGWRRPWCTWSATS